MTLLAEKRFDLTSVHVAEATAFVSEVAPHNEILQTGSGVATASEVHDALMEIPLLHASQKGWPALPTSRHGRRDAHGLIGLLKPLRIYDDVR